MLCKTASVIPLALPISYGFLKAPYYMGQHYCQLTSILAYNHLLQNDPNRGGNASTKCLATRD